MRRFAVRSQHLSVSWRVRLDISLPFLSKSSTPSHTSSFPSPAPRPPYLFISPSPTDSLLLPHNLLQASTTRERERERTKAMHKCPDINLLFILFSACEPENTKVLICLDCNSFQYVQEDQPQLRYPNAWALFCSPPPVTRPPHTRTHPLTLTDACWLGVERDLWAGTDADQRASPRGHSDIKVQGTECFFFICVRTGDVDAAPGRHPTAFWCVCAVN